MNSQRNYRRIFGYAVTSAMVGALLASCATEGKSTRADASASQAQEALAEGQTPEAIRLAEEAVVGEPRNASYRAMLGRAYMDAGRFASAASAFDDAMTLGDSSTRTALSMALSLIGEGKQQEAVALLGDWEKDIAPSDAGLAYSLAGDPARGIALLETSIRGGQNTAKSRQNLAYSYALAGRWREARLMAQQDVPADQIDNRIDQWSRTVAPEAYQARIATLLNVPHNVADAGQPTRLALANSPEVNQLLAEAAGAGTNAAAPRSGGELPALAALPASASGPQSVDPTVALEGYRAPAVERPRDFQTAFATQAPAGGSLAAVTQDAIRFAQSPEARSAPVRQGVTPTARPAQAAPALAPMAPAAPQLAAAPATAPQPRPAAVAPAQQVAQAQPTRAQAPAAAPTRVAAVAAPGGNRQAQLGSFTSEQGARRAWGTFVRQYPELANHRMVITQANVNGKQYWRVAAGGMTVAQSNSLCGKVKSRGNSCLAMAEAAPARDTRLASR